jgi:ATP-dependent Clp protease adaptor protein ClpS
MVKVSVIDDQTTPMDFVALVLESIFGHSPHEAVRITLLTDSDGEAVCGLCEDRVEAQVLVSAAVQISRQRGYPLQFSIVPVPLGERISAWLFNAVMKVAPAVGTKPATPQSKTSH